MQCHLPPPAIAQLILQNSQLCFPLLIFTHTLSLPNSSSHSTFPQATSLSCIYPVCLCSIHSLPDHTCKSMEWADSSVSPLHTSGHHSRLLTAPEGMQNFCSESEILTRPHFPGRWGYCVYALNNNFSIVPNSRQQRRDYLLRPHLLDLFSFGFHPATV